MNITHHHRKGTSMTKAPNRLMSLPHRLGVAGPACLRAPFKGPSAPSPTPVLATLATIAATLASAGLTAALPATASAYATLEGPPVFSTAPGLPDGRVYEQVSPANKDSNQAGAGTNGQQGIEHYALATASGNAVLFESTGAMGETAAAYNLHFVAEHTPSGWSTRSILPRTQGSAAEEGGELNISQLVYLDPSADLSHVAIVARNGRFSAPPNAKCGAENGGTEGERQLFLAGSDPFVPATWLARPKIANPIENCAIEGESGVPVGGTPNFSTVYFTFPGTLLSEDASRAPHAHGIAIDPEHYVEAWGFYEDREGVLHETGVLPDGSLDQFGAVPAASGHGRAVTGNQVSADGSRAFFVSPDPESCEQTVITLSGGGESHGQNNCAVNPPELYVRENGERTVLVSQDTLASPVDGLPVPAPSGPSQMSNPARQYGGNVARSYVVASSDGSQAFFQSADQLTSAAPEGPPGNTSVKTYDFDVNTETLTYLSNVTGQIVATDTDGSSFAFVNSTAPTPELDLWSSGPDGGSVTTIAQLPDGSAEPARMSSDGSVVVFTASGLSGFNDGGAGEIFRYEVATNTLACVSCAPAGVTPTGSAVMSPLRANESPGGELTGMTGLVDERGMSANGDRIFFDTPTPLTGQATNIGVSDVYEWENGVVYLISSGSSTEDSYFLDNSESGDDVFFATTEGLVPGDTDGAYDVYDARVPQPGDSAPPAAVPCEGSVCQGPPHVQSPLAPPARATFPGSDNLVPEVTPATTATKNTTTKTVKCKKGFAKKKNKCVKSPKRRKPKKASNDRRVPQ
jgi:hypothetical protein